MCNLKSALIPQPLLPGGEGEPIQILAPLPFWERGWGEGGSGKLHITLTKKLLAKKHRRCATNLPTLWEASYIPILLPKKIGS